MKKIFSIDTEGLLRHIGYHLNWLSTEHSGYRQKVMAIENAQSRHFCRENSLLRAH